MLPAILLLALPSAPAPVYRPRPAPLLVGAWDMDWSRQRCHVQLDRDGTYLCLWCGAVYSGTWRYDPRTRTLTVRESEGKDGSIVYRWSVRLDDGLAGEGQCSRDGGAPMPLTIQLRRARP